MDPRRKPLIAGNWKMNHGGASGVDLAIQVARAAAVHPGVETVVAPPFLAIPGVVRETAELARQHRCDPIGVAGQDVHAEAKGAFTGDVAASMLVEHGCRWAIVGHSERRQFHGETDAHVAKKARAALAAGLGAIVCVGETLDERQSGRTLEVVLRMVDACLDVLSTLGRDAGARGVIAYEPVWAIGTGKVATPGDAQEVHAAIRARLERRGAELAAVTRVLYGGSVNAKNSPELLAQRDIDGALVGGASLDIEQFGPILRAAQAIAGG